MSKEDQEKLVCTDDGNLFWKLIGSGIVRVENGGNICHKMKINYKWVGSDFENLFLIFIGFGVSSYPLKSS